MKGAYFSKGVETRPGIHQDVLPTNYVTILLKRARVVKFRHPREHPELNIH